MRDGVELLAELLIVVNYGKPRGLPTSKLSFQSVDHTATLLNMEVFSQFDLHLLLGNVGSLRMDHIDHLFNRSYTYHLPSTQQRILHYPPRVQQEW